MKKIEKRSIFIFVLAVAILISTVATPGRAEDYLGTLNDLSGEFITDGRFLEEQSNRMPQLGKRDVSGDEILMITLQAENVTKLLCTYATKILDKKSFKQSDISNDGYLYFIFRFSDTDNCTVKAGICYYSAFQDRFIDTHSATVDSGVTYYSSNIGRSDFDSIKTYYGFVKNPNEEGSISGWLHVYQMDPY